MVDDYINRHTIQGMMSKTAKPFDDWAGFWKNSKQVVVFDDSVSLSDFPLSNRISWGYLPSKENLDKRCSTYSSILVLSEFDRETRNHFNQQIDIQDNPISFGEVSSLIDMWDDQSGDKYGWQRHSGYDRNFFRKFWEFEKQDLWSNFFYLNGRLVGYSVVSKISDDGCFRYVIRKNDVSLRNLCLFIDFNTFERIFKEIQKPFLINWGASSGGVLKYKKKFPVFLEKKVFFGSEKR